MTQELKSIDTKYGKIFFRLIRSYRRKTMTICVDENACINVYVPSFIREKVVFDFIQEKISWIFRKVVEAKKRQVLLKDKRFEHGFMFLFLGKKYPLIVERDEMRKRARIDFDGTAWRIKLPFNCIVQDKREILIREKLISWYKSQAKELLPSRVFHYLRIIEDLPVKKIVVKTQKRLWGNCDYINKTIRLNWQIILAPIKVIDYVVVHEICHLIFPNHSKYFWRKVEEIFPEYKQSKRWLKQHYIDMSIL